ncbi:MAG: sulfatase-like hydrolase/transferase [Verrucomicrobiota bacterium]
MRRLFRFLPLFFLLVASATASDRPNFIVVMVDDMGYAGLSCFGNPYFETPELDRLAAEGMRFTDFHSSGTVCSPTRAGLLTGRYQQRTGIEAVIHPVSDHPEHLKGLQISETTFAELLKEQGYATGLIGKWHLGYPQNSDDYHPQNHGFDEFVGYHSGNIDFVSHVGDHYRHDWWHGKIETPEEGYTTHLINDYAVDFVRRHGSGDTPFCLYVAHEAIHNPVQVPGDPVRRTLEEWDRWNWKNATEEERIGKYRGMTLPIDEGIGQLRNVLEEVGADRNTLILFFSDNGPAREFPSGDPRWRGAKGSVYEGGHRVSAFAWWPDVIKEGQVSDQTLLSLDVMPTLLSLSGLDPADYELDGIDLSNLLSFGEALAPRPLFWASMSNGGIRSEAMREGPWKLVVQHPKSTPGTFENESVELYHLDHDPSETDNLAEKETTRSARMLADLKSWIVEVTDEATPQVGGWLAKSSEEEILIRQELTLDGQLKPRIVSP